MIHDKQQRELGPWKKMNIVRLSISGQGFQNVCDNPNASMDCSIALHKTSVVSIIFDNVISSIGVSCVIL